MNINKTSCTSSNPENPDSDKMQFCENVDEYKKLYGLDYLLTWNCKHIANPYIQKKLSQIADSLGYELPTICTPYEMLGE